MNEETKKKYSYLINIFLYILSVSVLVSISLTFVFTEDYIASVIGFVCCAYIMTLAKKIIDT